jgi:hypothetical protein
LSAITLPARNKVVRPATRWKNKWSTARRVLNYANMEYVGPGEFLGALVYPTREIAEQKALEELRLRPATHARCGTRYLGPVAIDD